MGQGYGYRTEIVFGEGYSDPVEVMAHETFSLQNTDVLRTLSEGVLYGTELSGILLHIADVIEGGVRDDGLQTMLDDVYRNDADDGRRLFSELVVPEIVRITGRPLTHVMWLCDTPDDVIDSYGMLDDVGYDDIDRYPVGHVVLSDIGYEGKLWGYDHDPRRF